MEDWPKLKPTIPGHRVPVLDVIGPNGVTKHYQESMAIARLFARKFKMMGATDEEYYQIERMIGQASWKFED